MLVVLAPQQPHDLLAAGAELSTRPPAITP
jgi:hypothetical protein